jgi:hypothetical protein
MLVQVFEDENEAAKYCDLLQGGCEGVAEIDASSVQITKQLYFDYNLCCLRTLNNKCLHDVLQIFDLCKKMRALAVLFRRGRTPPVPESLKLNLRARKRSLEDQDDLI